MPQINCNLQTGCQNVYHTSRFSTTEPKPQTGSTYRFFRRCVDVILPMYMTDLLARDRSYGGNLTFGMIISLAAAGETG